MTNEEKAKDITKCLWFPQKCTEEDIQNMLMEMAQWKDEQHEREKQKLIDEACERLEEYFAPDGSMVPENIGLWRDLQRVIKGEKL